MECGRRTQYGTLRLLHEPASRTCFRAQDLHRLAQLGPFLAVGRAIGRWLLLYHVERFTVGHSPCGCSSPTRPYLVHSRLLAMDGDNIVTRPISDAERFSSLLDAVALLSSPIFKSTVAHPHGFHFDLHQKGNSLGLQACSRAARQGLVLTQLTDRQRFPPAGESPDEGCEYSSTRRRN